MSSNDIYIYTFSFVMLALSSLGFLILFLSKIDNTMMRTCDNILRRFRPYSESKYETTFCKPSKNRFLVCIIIINLSYPYVYPNNYRFLFFTISWLMVFRRVYNLLKTDPFVS